jgi:hypothetical protein
MQEVRLRLCPPALQESGLWRCEILLDGLSRRGPPPGHGIDSLQAVGSAVQLADLWLETMPECKAGELFHHDGSRYTPMRDRKG